MTKQKSKIISKYPLKRRKTFKKHSKHYAKVYAPYLPAVIGLVIGFGLLIPHNINHVKSVLSYATSTTPASLLDETNNRRDANHVGDLIINQKLTAAAQLKANDMAARNYWAHVTPDGKQPWYFIEKSGYKYSEAAENLAYGFTSSQDTVNGWMNSPQHRKALLDKDFSDVGFGIANTADYQDHGAETIVVAMYAKSQQPNLAKVNSAFSIKPAKNISFGQIWTRGSSPWINLIMGVAIGIIAMYLATTHSLKLRKKLRQGEEYVLGHPVLDITLIALLVLMIALSKTAGFIQ